MSKKQEAFRAHQIYNSHGICERGGGRVFLSYTPQGDGRSLVYPHWSVVGVKHNTDPSAHWMHYGCKTFSGKLRSHAFDEAKAWASGKYGIKEWRRDPFGGWQDAEVLKRAEAIAGTKQRRITRP